jgi:protein gp37
MGEDSKIQWTDHTFNPWIGCTKVSQGCKYCYAEKLMTRKGQWKNTWGPSGHRVRTSEQVYWKQPHTWNRKAEKLGIRHKVFCGSLCDVFEEFNPQALDLDEWRLDLWSLIQGTPYLDWLLLTKRPENIKGMVPIEWLTEMWPNNVWVGTSVENQETYDQRAPKLMKIPAPVRFLSCEPLLGPISLRTDVWLYPSILFDKNGIDWVIVGGESGPDARPMYLEWANALRSECYSSYIPFFMKQLGGHPDKQGNMEDFPELLRVREFPPVIINEDKITF